MKNISFSITVSALALTLAAPSLALAKSSSHHFNAINHTTSGAVDTTGNGVGTYTKTVTGTGRDRVVTTNTNFADGKTITSTDTIVKNPNGTVTSDMTTDLANGKTVSKDVVITKTGAGDETVAGTVTQGNGSVDQLSGTTSATSYGTATQSTLTNAKGETKTLDGEILKTGDASADVVSGTGYKGQNIGHASLKTTNGAASGNDVDTTANGQGVYTISSTTTGATTTIDNNRMFNNGASTSSTNAVTENANGTTTYATTTDTINANGSTGSSSGQRTYTSNGNGTDTISGTFSNSNGLNGTVSGTGTQTNYGYYTSTDKTNQYGGVARDNTQTLTVGDAVLNVSSGNNFPGQSTSSAGLATGQQSSYVGLNHPEGNM